MRDKFFDVKEDVRKGWIRPRPENPPEEVRPASGSERAEAVARYANPSARNGGW